MRRHRSTLTDFLHRLVAGSSAALLLLLAALVASPQLHQHAHGEHDVDLATDNCAVVLFGHGVSLAVDSAALSSPAIAWREQRTVPAIEVFVATPRYLRQPERGPPLS